MATDKIEFGEITFTKEDLDNLLLDIVELYNLSYNIIDFKDIDSYAKHLIKLNYEGYRKSLVNRKKDPREFNLFKNIADNIHMLNMRYRVV